MAARKSKDVKFAGRSQEELLELIVASAASATKKAVKENDELGFDSPGSRNGKLVVRKPGGEEFNL